MKIKTVTILGANGNMGSQCAGLITAFGNTETYLVAQTIEKATEAVEKAIRSIKSETIRKRMIPITYNELTVALRKSDWVLEAVGENYEVKGKVYQLLGKTEKKGRIITTITSGLAIHKLAESLGNEEKKRFFGTHFFNPPYKMLLCELIGSKYSDEGLLFELKSYLENVLLRKVIVCNDTPGFLANRIGFQCMNEALQYSEKYRREGGIAYIDQLLGRHTGRALSPIETINFVGLDVHEAIVNNLYSNTNDHARRTYILSKYVKKLIDSNKLGVKSGVGLYKYEKDENGKKVKYYYDHLLKQYVKVMKIESPVISSMKADIRVGRYNEAFSTLFQSRHPHAKIIQYFIARYISYSYSLIGEVVAGHEQVDIAMGYGFNWIPPSALVDIIGGPKNAIRLIGKYKLPIPNALISQKSSKQLYKLGESLDARSFLRT